MQSAVNQFRYVVMSDPVEAFRAAFERFAGAFNAGDFERASQAFTEDYEQVFPPGFTHDRIRGRDEWVRFFKEFRSDIPDWRVRLGEVSQLDDGRFIAHFDYQGSGRSSGVSSTFEVWALLELGEGGVRRNVEFRTRAEALAAAQAREGIR